MSHFTRIQTRMTEGDYLFDALTALRCNPRRGSEEVVRGWNRQTESAEIVIPTQRTGYDIGFRRASAKQGNAYQCIADWQELRGTVSRQDFLDRVQQRYAYQASLAELESQGFSLAAVETNASGQIHLTLRRAS